MPCNVTLPKRSLSGPICSKYILFLLILFFIHIHPTFSQLNHVDRSDKEIEEMTIDELLQVEHDLRHQNKRVDKHTKSLHGRLKKLRYEQKSLEKNLKRASTARDFEVTQRRKREEDLNRAHAQLQAKQSQIKLITVESSKLQERINDISQSVLSLNHEKHRLRAEYVKPSLKQAVLHDAQKAGPVTEHIANKTITDLLPTIKKTLKEAEYARHALQNSTPSTALFTSFVLYILCISALCIVYRFFRHVAKRITMQRLIVSVDMAFAIMWFFIIICIFLISGRDPLEELASRAHKGLSLILQIGIIVSLIFNVVLRCLVLAVGINNYQHNINNKLDKSTVIMELFLVLFITQHYYQGVWVPVLFDKPVLNTASSYFLYMLINGGLAIYRARLLCRPKYVHDVCTQHPTVMSRFGDKLNTVKKGTQWLKDKMERAFRYVEEWLTRGSVVYDTDEDDDESIHRFTNQNCNYQNGERNYDQRYKSSKKPKSKSKSKSKSKRSNQKQYQSQSLKHSASPPPPTLRSQKAPSKSTLRASKHLRV